MSKCTFLHYTFYIIWQYFHFFVHIPLQPEIANPSFSQTIWKVLRTYQNTLRPLVCCLNMEKFDHMENIQDKGAQEFWEATEQ